jgi:hypothetical protein
MESYSEGIEFIEFLTKLIGFDTDVETVDTVFVQAPETGEESPTINMAADWIECADVRMVVMENDKIMCVQCTMPIQHDEYGYCCGPCLRQRVLHENRDWYHPFCWPASRSIVCRICNRTLIE